MRGRWVGWLIALLCGAALAEEPPTGVIIDASLLDIKRCRFPKIYDADEVMVYPPVSLFSNADYMQGFVGFMPSVAEARKKVGRVGERPWVVRPAKLHEADPTCGSIDLDADQTARLAEIEAATGVLAKDRVLIVIGLAVAGSAPAPDAVDAAADATVTITLSKSLREGQRQRLEVYQRTAEGEVRVPGEVIYQRDARRLEFRPAAPWTAGATYEARLPADLQAETMATLGEGYTLVFTIAQPASASDTDPAADTSSAAQNDPDDAGAGPGADGGGSGTGQGASKDGAAGGA